MASTSPPRPIERGRTMPAELAGREPSISKLVADLTHETTDLVRKEAELARVETANAVARLEAGLLSMALGGGVAGMGLLFLLAAAVLGIDLALHALWLSTLIVGAAVVLVGAVLLALGRRNLAHLAPERTLRSLRRDKELLQEHLPGGGA